MRSAPDLSHGTLAQFLFQQVLAECSSFIQLLTQMTHNQCWNNRKSRRHEVIPKQEMIDIRRDQPVSHDACQGGSEPREQSFPRSGGHDHWKKHNQNGNPRQAFYGTMSEGRRFLQDGGTQSHHGLVGQSHIHQQSRGDLLFLAEAIDHHGAHRAGTVNIEMKGWTLPQSRQTYG